MHLRMMTQLTLSCLARQALLKMLPHLVVKSVPELSRNRKFGFSSTSTITAVRKNTRALFVSWRDGIFPGLTTMRRKLRWVTLPYRIVSLEHGMDSKRGTKPFLSSCWNYIFEDANSLRDKLTTLAESDTNSVSRAVRKVAFVYPAEEGLLCRYRLRSFTNANR